MSTNGPDNIDFMPPPPPGGDDNSIPNFSGLNLGTSKPKVTLTKEQKQTIQNTQNNVDDLINDIKNALSKEDDNSVSVLLKELSTLAALYKMQYEKEKVDRKFTDFTSQRDNLDMKINELKEKKEAEPVEINKAIKILETSIISLQNQYNSIKKLVDENKLDKNLAKTTLEKITLQIESKTLSLDECKNNVETLEKKYSTEIKKLENEKKQVIKSINEIKDLLKFSEELSKLSAKAYDEAKKLLPKKVVPNINAWFQNGIIDGIFAINIQEFLKIDENDELSEIEAIKLLHSFLNGQISIALDPYIILCIASGEITRKEGTFYSKKVNKLMSDTVHDDSKKELTQYLLGLYEQYQTENFKNNGLGKFDMKKEMSIVTKSSEEQVKFIELNIADQAESSNSKNENKIKLENKEEKNSKIEIKLKPSNKRNLSEESKEKTNVNSNPFDKLKLLSNKENINISEKDLKDINNIKNKELKLTMLNDLLKEEEAKKNQGKFFKLKNNDLDKDPDVKKVLEGLDDFVGNENKLHELAKITSELEKKLKEGTLSEEDQNALSRLGDIFGDEKPKSLSGILSLATDKFKEMEEKLKNTRQTTPLDVLSNALLKNSVQTALELAITHYSQQNNGDLPASSVVQTWLRQAKCPNIMVALKAISPALSAVSESIKNGKIVIPKKNNLKF